MRELENILDDIDEIISYFEKQADRLKKYAYTPLENLDEMSVVLMQDDVEALDEWIKEYKTEMGTFNDENLPILDRITDITLKYQREPE